MAGELAKAGDKSGVLVTVAPNANAGIDVFNEMSSNSDYLPRIQLYGANSEEVKEGRMPMGHFGLVLTKENIIDLKKETDVLVINFRPKAMEIGDRIINIYDHTSAEFARIKNLAGTQDSGCMYGPEFLIWVPGQKKFATFFCNSKTARRAAPSLHARLGMAATLRSNLIKSGKYSWHGPEFLPCSTPFGLPDPEDIQEENEKFINPPKSDVEAAPESSNKRQR